MDEVLTIALLPEPVEGADQPPPNVEAPGTAGVSIETDRETPLSVKTGD
jgi:hypothetical protein